MTSEWHGGKGSGRRKEDASKISENWDLIFGKNKEQPMNDNEHDDEQHDHDEDGEWCCDMCGGPMYKQAHWNYAQCDDCGATQGLINDDYN